VLLSPQKKTNKIKKENMIFFPNKKKQIYTSKPQFLFRKEKKRERTHGSFLSPQKKTPKKALETTIANWLTVL
jgi:hypothetical protein